MDMYDILLARNLGGSGGTVDAYTKAQTDALLNGKANLVDGKIPAAELPSYVDDVLEYAGTSAFPVTGESGKIYIATDTNKTYRWGGSAYVEISESLALGETASTAYPGNKGKANADAIAAIKDGTNVDSFADVEIALSAKLNTADVDTAISSTSTNPVQNKAVQAPLARLVDAGAKNLIDILHPSNSRLQTIIENANGTYTLSGSGAWLSWDVVCSVKQGTKYIFRCNFTSVSTDGNGVFVIKDANASDLFRRNINNDTDIELEIEPSTATVTIGFSTNNGSTSGSGSFTMNPILCTAEDYAISQEFVPYAMSNAELTDNINAVQAPIAQLVDNGAKNLFQYNPVAEPEISYVINGDGSITVTANNTTGVRVFVLGLVTNLEDGKKYTLSGVTGGNYDSSYGFAIGTSNATGKVFLSDGHVDFVKTSEMYQFELVVRAGQSWTKTFYPMLCTAEDYAISPEFVPYTPTMREMYQAITKTDTVVHEHTAADNYEEAFTINIPPGKTMQIMAGGAWSNSQCTGVKILYGGNKIIAVNEPSASQSVVCASGCKRNGGSSQMTVSVLVRYAGATVNEVYIVYTIA